MSALDRLREMAAVSGPKVVTAAHSAAATAGTSAFSNTVNATTMAVPANPTSLTATTTNASQINLAWTNNAVKRKLRSVARPCGSSL